MQESSSRVFSVVAFDRSAPRPSTSPTLLKFRPHSTHLASSKFFYSAELRRRIKGRNQVERLLLLSVLVSSFVVHYSATLPMCACLVSTAAPYTKSTSVFFLIRHAHCYLPLFFFQVYLSPSAPYFTGLKALHSKGCLSFITMGYL